MKLGCHTKVGGINPRGGVENSPITCSCSLLWCFCQRVCCCQWQLSCYCKCLSWCVSVCVWSCSPLMANDTANYNDSHCDVVDDIDTHDESDESLIFSTPTLPSSSPSCSQVIDDVPTGRKNICSALSAITPHLSLFSTQHHSSHFDLVLVLACTFVIFILTYLFFCFVLALMGLRVIAKFSIELD